MLLRISSDVEGLLRANGLISPTEDGGVTLSADGLRALRVAVDLTKVQQQIPEMLPQVHYIPPKIVVLRYPPGEEEQAKEILAAVARGEPIMLPNEVLRDTAGGMICDERGRPLLAWDLCVEG
jgi:hypothetical protein